MGGAVSSTLTPTARPDKLGVLGGTFDPVHVGHLAIADTAAAALGLDRVLFVPAGRPRFKDSSQVSPASHRLAMLNLAVRPYPSFGVYPAEIDRPGPTYTIDTLTELAGDHLHLLLGVDALNDLHRWRDPAGVLDMAKVVGVSRPGAGSFDPRPLDAIVPGASRSIILLDGPGINLSGSRIRSLAAAGRPITGLVPDPVARYLHSHRLYSAP